MGYIFLKVVHGEKTIVSDKTKHDLRLNSMVLREMCDAREQKYCGDQFTDSARCKGFSHKVAVAMVMLHLFLE